MHTAKESGQPYIVEEISQEDILDFRDFNIFDLGNLKTPMSNL